MEPEFPISVRFENGEVEEYEDVDELIEDLEDFDSDLDTACDARDARGRSVRLKLKASGLEGVVVGLTIRLESGRRALQRSGPRPSKLRVISSYPECFSRAQSPAHSYKLTFPSFASR